MIVDWITPSVTLVILGMFLWLCWHSSRHITKVYSDMATFQTRAEQATTSQEMRLLLIEVTEYSKKHCDHWRLEARAREVLDYIGRRLTRRPNDYEMRPRYNG